MSNRVCQRDNREIARSLKIVEIDPNTMQNFDLRSDKQVESQKFGNCVAAADGRHVVRTREDGCTILGPSGEVTLPIGFDRLQE